MGTKLEIKKEILKKKGLKVTKSRLMVLEILANTKKPINAETLLNKIGKKKTDLSTIYRSLSSFSSKGLIRKIEIGESSSCYELKNNHHHHIVCQKCGFVEDLNICNINKIQNAIIRSAKHFNEIEEHSFEMFGICQKCKKRSST